MRIKFWLIAVLAFCVRADAQPSYALHTSYAVRYRVIDSLVHSPLHTPATAPETYERMALWAKEKGDEPFYFDLRILALRWQIVENTDPKQRVAALKLLEELQADNMLMQKADVLRLLAEYWAAQRKYAQSLEYELEAHGIYAAFSPQEFPPKQEYLYLLGSRCFQYGDDERAYQYLKAAEAIKGGPQLFHQSIYNALGLYYRKRGMYDSARKYFLHIFDVATANNDPQWIGISAGNLGGCYFLKGNYLEAIPLLRQDINLSIANKQLSNAVNSMGMLAISFIETGRRDTAEKLLWGAAHLCYENAFWHNYKFAADLYGAFARLYAANGNYAKAYRYADSQRIAADSAYAQMNSLAMAKAHDKVELAQHKLALEKLAGQKQLQTLTRNALIVLIILVTIIFGLVINRQLHRQKRLQLELTSAAEQLERFRKNVHEKNKIIEQFEAEMERMNENSEANHNSDVLAQIQNSIILTDEQWEDFRVIFEKVHKGFFKRVKEKMPDLTPAELRFVALSKLKLSPREMAGMLGISPNSIRNYRHRLRRKLGLGENASIEEMADAI